MDTFNIIRCLLLGMTAVIGDKLVLINQQDDLRKAVCDNMTHAAIGFLTWININYYLGRVTSLSGRLVAQSLLCAFISSAIDIDHFISAWSFHLKDATKLSRRPLLHCTTLPLLICVLMFLTARYMHCANVDIFGWMLLASFLSHHIRDAARRGIWLYPFGSTPPLGTGVYLCLTVLLPFLISMSMIFATNSLLRPQRHSGSILDV